jgi:glycosyltransferase involved in cell wall biosynthesis
VTRILQVVQHLRPGGIETMALDLLGRAGPGREVEIASLEGSTSGLIAAWPSLAALPRRIHGLGKRPGLQPLLILRLARLMRRLGTEIVHTHHIGPLIYGGLAGRLAGVRRVVHTEHDAWHLAAPRRRRVEALALRLVRPVLVADAAFVERALARAFPSRPALLIRNGIDTERFAPGDRAAARHCFGLPPDAPTIGCAARLERVKGVDLLLEAFAQLSAPTRLAIAGDGAERENLRDLAIARGLADRVDFLGRIDDMPKFYQALDVFCLASRAEGLPLSLLEAQASGVPAVAFDVGGVTEALCPRTGRLVPAGDIAALGRALAEAVAVPSTDEPCRFVRAERGIAEMARAYGRCYDS